MNAERIKIKWKTISSLYTTIATTTKLNTSSSKTWKTRGKAENGQEDIQVKSEDRNT